MAQATLLLFSMLVGMGSSQAIAEEPQHWTFSSPSQKAAQIVELYTSEGCSSCPPADQFVIEQSKESKHERIFLVFHVDYWDGLGWKDPWASPLFTERQRSYAFWWGIPRVYTPEFVIDGQEWRGFFERQSLPSPSEKVVGHLKVRLPKSQARKGPIVVQFASSAREGDSRLATVALVASGLESQVGSGENSGMRLKHDHVVLKWLQIDLKKRSDGKYQGQGPWALNPPKGVKAREWSLVVWVSENHSPKPLQAVRYRLPAKFLLTSASTSD